MNNAVALAIKVTSDARGAAAGIDSATGKVSKLGKAGQVAGRLLAAGLLAAGAAAIKFANAAAEDQAAATQLAQTAKQAAGATDAQTAAMESWIAAQGKAVGVADDELRPAMSKLITATGDVGKAQKLAALAMDISARSGKSLDSVAQSLAKAQNGSVAGLGKYGIATKDAAGKAKSLAEVQKALADSYTGAAAAGAETAAGKAKRLEVSMGELQEEIGAKLLPVLLKAAEYGLKVVEWIDKNQAAAGAILGVLGGLLAIIKAISIAQGILNTVMAANPAVLITIAIIALVAALVIAYKRSETFREIVNTVFKSVADTVRTVVDVIRTVWGKLVSILSGPVSTAVGLVKGYYGFMITAALTVIDWVRSKWPTIETLIVTPFKIARATVAEVIDKVTSTFSAAKDTITTTASAIKDAFTAAFGAIRDAVQWVIDKVQALIDKINSIPKPDLTPGFDVPGVPVVRAASGYAGKGALLMAGQRTAGPNELHVHLHLDGATYLGTDTDLAGKLRQLLADEVLRYNGLVPNLVSVTS